MSTRQTPNPLLELYDPKEFATTDIIFVHGLGGDRITTWTCDSIKSKPTFWPQDLLPKSCEAARILLFGYDATLAHFYPKEKDKSEQPTIDDHSTALLRSLIDLRERTSSTDRPLIFIAHSLGGLVCANALSRDHGSDEAIENLSAMTAGIVFLGTPLGRANPDIWGMIGLRILKSMSVAHSENAEDLEERSTKLAEVSHTFAKYLRKRDRYGGRDHLEVACFFEEHPTLKTGEEAFYIVPKEIARLPGIDALPIPANHIDICRFESHLSAGYEDIQVKLEEWIRIRDRWWWKSKENKINIGDVSYEQSASYSGNIIGNITGSGNSYVFSIGAPTGPNQPVPGLPPPEDDQHAYRGNYFNSPI